MAARFSGPDDVTSMYILSALQQQSHDPFAAGSSKSRDCNNDLKRARQSALTQQQVKCKTLACSLVGPWTVGQKLELL